MLSAASLDVSVVVPTYNRADLLPRTLAALACQRFDRSRYEVIVIDDGSSMEVKAIVRAVAGNGGLIWSQRQANRGVATARNNGARLARGATLVFVDDDIISPPEMIARHVEILERNARSLSGSYWKYERNLEEALRQGPFGRFRLKLEYASGTKTLRELPLVGDDLYEAKMLAGWNLAVRREHFWEIGGFDEDFPYAGAEDEEFCIRARALGFRFLLDSRVRLENHDRRLTFEHYCEREQRGAVTRVLMAQKHPTCGAPVSIVENGFLTRGDSPRLASKKIVKSILARAGILRLLQRSIAVLEGRMPQSQFLQRLYRLTCGLYVFRGVREGLGWICSRPD